MTPEEKAFIAEYACSRPETLEIAVKVAKSFDAIQRRVVKDFFEALEEQLREKFSGSVQRWTITNDFSARGVDRHARFEIFRAPWGGEHRVGRRIGFNRYDVSIIHRVKWTVS